MIHFVVDSTFYLPKEYIKKNNIKIAGLKAMLDNKTYEEIDKNNWSVFFEDLKKSKGFPKTTQPSPEEFTNIFNQIFTEDENAQIIVLTISLSLSGTFNVANLVAKNYTNKDIAVIDSYQTAQSSMLLLEELLELNKIGKTHAEIVEAALKLREKTMIQFVPTSLEYLRRGGRIGTISATIANVLNVKPLLAFKSGVLKCYKRVIGINRAIVEMINNIPKNLKRIYVCYIHESEFISVVKEKVEALFNLKDVKVLEIGPVVGSHIGIGAVGVATIEN